MLVVDGKLISVARRVPGHVVGDGEHTIEGLVEIENQDPRRGIGHEKILTRLELDYQAQRLLGQMGYEVSSVPPDGEVVFLRSTGNLSTGGTATDVTDVVHPDNVDMALRAAKAIGLVYPELAGKLHGAAMRVPVADGSVCDLTFVASRESSVDELKEAFLKASNGYLKGILRATNEPLVSTDIIGETHSSVVDLALIAQVAPTFFRIVSWYDNENAYALRCVDLLEYMVGKE